VKHLTTTETEEFNRVLTVMAGMASFPAKLVHSYLYKRVMIFGSFSILVQCANVYIKKKQVLKCKNNYFNIFLSKKYF
jgi:PAB1-binding protein PBP1